MSSLSNEQKEFLQKIINTWVAQGGSLPYSAEISINNHLLQFIGAAREILPASITELLDAKETVFSASFYIKENNAGIFNGNDNVYNAIRDYYTKRIQPQRTTDDTAIYQHEFEETEEELLAGID